VSNCPTGCVVGLILLAIVGLLMFWFLRRKVASEDEVNLVGNMERGSNSPKTGKSAKKIDVDMTVAYIAVKKLHTK
jgi:hypothetical protein